MSALRTTRTPLLRLCHFDSPFLPLQPYFCYNNEVCCKEGCCIRHTNKYIQSWQIWYKIYIVFGILVIFLFYRYFYWYCKKRRQENFVQNDDNNHVINMMVAFNNRRNSENDVAPKDDPPPVYNEALKFPKPEEAVPTYEQAMHQNQKN